MLIKIFPYRRIDPQRPGQLAGLVRYILADRGGNEEKNILNRLAGPTFTQRIIQRVIPYDSEYQVAATDIANQFFELIRSGCIDRDLPHQVFAHVVVSFSPAYRRKQAKLQINSNTKNINEPTFSRSLRIVLDVLYQLGICEKTPLYLALHNNRRHLHAHALCGLYAAGMPDSKLHEINNSKIRSIAKKIDEEHGLSRISKSLQRGHDVTVESYKNQVASS